MAGFIMATHAQPRLVLQPFASGFSEPVSLAAQGDRVFVVERRGTIRIINANGQVVPGFFLDIQVPVLDDKSERGLLGLAFHPGYTQNGFFFVNYTTSGGKTRISRFSVSGADPNQADPNSELILLEYDQPFDNHNGGDLKFGPDGYLYIASGDGGSGGDPGNRAQNGNELLGKILRIDVDNGNPYAIPADNPFVNDPAVRDEIWATGLRNPWRIAFDRQNGDFWIADVGQEKWEEINLAPGNSGGLNYGWRCYEGNEPYNLNGCGPVTDYTAPVYEYGHPNGNSRSVTGGFVYRGNLYPSLQGHYIFGDFSTGEFWTLFQNGSAYDTTQQGDLVPNFQLTTFGEDENGELYVATAGQGQVYRITEKGGPAGLLDQRRSEPLKVYPVPARGLVRVAFPEDQPKYYQLSIKDLRGKTLWRQQGFIAGSTEIKLDGLPAGFYLVQANSQDRLFSGRLVVAE